MRTLVVSEILALTVVGLSCPVALAKSYIVGERETAEIVVSESGSVELTDAVAVANGGSLYKSGPGELVVSDKLFVQENPARIGVKDGTIKVKLEAAIDRPTPPMPTALSVAALWLDASKSESLIAPAENVANQTAPVAKWLDARETNAAKPTYMYAKGNAQYPTLNWTQKLPEAVTKDGVSAVYFGGLGSGTYMDFFHPDGNIYSTKSTTAKERRIWHAYVVYGVYGSHGFLFGDPNAEPCLEPGYFLSAANSIASPFARANGCRYEYNARWSYNGSVFDPVTEKPKLGFNLLEMTAGETPWYAATLFRDRWLHNDASVNRPAGGDYIAEYVIFTNQLNNIQREQVAAYLTRKWFPSRKAPLEVVMGEGANGGVVTIEATADGTVLLAGDCNVVKTGAGTATLDVVPGMKWTGTVTVREGRATVPDGCAVAVGAGTCVTSAKTADGANLLAFAAADAKSLVKDGVGSLALASVPASVESITVNAGELVLAGAKPSAPAYVANSEEYEPTLKNPGFETWTSGDSGVKTFSNGSYNNWTTVAGATAFYDYLSSVKINGEVNPEGFSLKSAPLGAPNDPNAFSSKTAFFFRQATTHSATQFSVTKAGWYELSFDVCGREINGFAGYLLKADYKSSDGSKLLANFGYAHYEGGAGFKRKYLTAYVPKTTSGYLHFTGSSSGDISVAIDNVRLRYLSAVRPNETAVPGGDFEETALKDGKSRSFSSTSPATSSNWTFNQNPDWTAATPSVGLTAYSMGISESTKTLTTGQGMYYNDSRGPGNGYGLLYFQTSASAQVAFAPPAGRWRVKAQIASKDNNKTGTLACSVNGVSLGTVKSTRTVFQDVVWPESFASDGTSAVTLKLDFAVTRQSGYPGALFVDNVVLVPVEEELPSGAFAMTGKPSIVLGETATLKLDFSGTNVVSRLRRGTDSRRDVVSAENCDWISGPGVLRVEPRGFMLFVR